VNDCNVCRWRPAKRLVGTFLPLPVTYVLVAALAIDRHADVAVDRFRYANADLGPAIVGDRVQVFHQRLEFLEGLQPLPLS